MNISQDDNECNLKKLLQQSLQEFKECGVGYMSFEQLEYENDNIKHELCDPETNGTRFIDRLFHSRIQWEEYISQCATGGGKYLCLCGKTIPPLCFDLTIDACTCDGDDCWARSSGASFFSFQCAYCNDYEYHNPWHPPWRLELPMWAPTIHTIVLRYERAITSRIRPWNHNK